MVSCASSVEPSRNSTVVTLPSASPAVAVTVIVGFHAKVAPSVGDVTTTVGGLFPVTVTVEAALVVVAPTSSVARAVSVYVPTRRYST